MDIMKHIKGVAVGLVLLCGLASAQVKQFVPANTLQGNNTALAAPTKPLTVSQVNALLGINSNAIPIGLTIAQLTAQFPAANYPNNTVVPTSDDGLVQSNGSAWIAGIHYPLFQTSVPMIIAPSGTMGNNCAINLGSNALDLTYPSAFIQLPSNSIKAGAGVVLPYVQMSSTTLGTCFQQQYSFGQPIVPTSPTAYASTGPGAFTANTTQSLVTYSVNIPAFAMGLSGKIEIKYTYSQNGTNSKAAALFWGATEIGATENETTAGTYTVTRTIINQGTTGAQLVMGTSGTGAVAAQTFPTINTTLPMALEIQFNRLASANDWIVLRSLTVDLYPSGTLDTPPTPALTVASNIIVPPCAAAFGYNTNKFFLNPTKSMIAIFPTAGFPLQSVSSLAHYSDVTINGIHYLSVNQLGDGVNTNFFTDTVGTIAPIASANGWYYEVASTITNISPDHWQDAFSDPVEKNAGGAVPFVEVDGDEQLGSLNSGNTFWGSTESIIDWCHGSGSLSCSQSNNLNLTNAGANIDRTKEHIYGWGYDPVGQQTFYCLDGRRQPFSPSTSGFNADIATLHYVIAVGAQSHTSGSGGIPYSNLIRYISGWSTTDLWTPLRAVNDENYRRAA
jgi:hypothetical protein